MYIEMVIAYSVSVENYTLAKREADLGLYWHRNVEGHFYKYELFNLVMD